tara:strand:- start:66 stop:668 length:603 start_codon:yes stop_codon:yes gene_type:complete
MPKTWFTADLHLGDGRLHLFPRPFNNETHAAHAMIFNWNEVVGQNDTVYVVGDFALTEKWLHYGGELLNGMKHLILGNYDQSHIDLYEQYFETVSGNAIIESELIEPPLYLQHYPSKSVPDMFNLVGHIHGSWRVQKNMLNVGVDVHNYYPISEEQVAFFFNAIDKHYDQNVWVGDHPANTAHNNRGETDHVSTGIPASV